jgi:hypothetical protein
MPKYKPLPPLERLNALFEVVEIPPDKYGEWSGLVWKVRKGRQLAGNVAGHRQPNLQSKGRFDWVVKVDGVLYYTPRVIYKLVYKTDPIDSQVDHIDQNSNNNNIWNLRLDVDGKIQGVNQPIRCDNTRGVVGVCLDKRTGKWIAQVRIKGSLKTLGRYFCKVEAARAIKNKWIELGWDKLGRKLPDLNKVDCACSTCSSM